MCVLANEGTIAPFECLVFTNFDANEIQQKNKLCTSAIFIGNIYSRRNINSGQNLYSGRNIYNRLDIYSGRDILQQDLKQQIQSCITKQALLP